MTQWFRSWHGGPTDTKWLAIARRSGVAPIIVSGVAWALLDYASQAEERGSVIGFDVEGFAAWAGVDEEQIAAVIAAMTDKGIIVDGHWAAWEKRQPKREDDSTHRVRAMRQAQKAAEPSVATAPDALPDECNAVKRNVTQRNAPEESRGDTEQTNPPLPPQPDPDSTASVPVPAGDERNERPPAPPNETWALIESVFAVTGADPQDMSQSERSRMGGIARRLLRDHDATDIVTCAQWLWSQPFHRDRGIDLLTIQKQMTRWVTAGKPRTAPSRASPNSPIRPVPAYYQDFPDDLSPHPKERSA